MMMGRRRRGARKWIFWNKISKGGGVLGCWVEGDSGERASMGPIR